MGLGCLYMINWLLSTFCLFVWQCLANLKKLGCNSARSTLGIPSGASGRCRSSRLPDVMPFSRGGQGSDWWASAWVQAWDAGQSCGNRNTATTNCCASGQMASSPKRTSKENTGSRTLRVLSLRGLCKWSIKWPLTQSILKIILIVSKMRFFSLF